MLRVGMISYWHVHADEYTQAVVNHPDTQVAYVWDEIPERGQRKAAQYNVPYVASLEELLQSDIDAVVVDAPTNMHKDILIQAARAGKHIFTEKVVAPTYAEVNAILAAVREAGVILTVSLPRLYDNYTQSILRVIEGGALGQLTLARVRLSHHGATANWLPAHFFSLEQCCGGALIDLGCHPMYLVRRFLGIPTSVHASYGYVTGREVEDNAVATLSYDNGAIGVVEAGFVNAHSPFSIELHGTEGTLLYGFPDANIQMRVKGQDGWAEVPLADRLPKAFEQWVDHIQQQTIASENIEIATDLTLLMEAANRSNAERRSIHLDEIRG